MHKGLVQLFMKVIDRLVIIDLRMRSYNCTLCFVVCRQRENREFNFNVITLIFLCTCFITDLGYTCWESIE